MNPLIGIQYAMVRSLNTVRDDPHSPIENTITLRIQVKTLQEVLKYFKVINYFYLKFTLT